MATHQVQLNLAKDLRKFGAFDIDACFNCGNCTAVCQHSEATASFPRRLIRYGQIGMADRVKAAKEAWLCWNCGDCSDTCPRQANPGEFVEAVRRYNVASVDPTGITRLMYTSNYFLVVFSVFLAVLFAGVLMSQAHTPIANEFAFFSFIPFEIIHDLGIVVLALMGIVALVNSVRLASHISRSMDSGSADTPRDQSAKGLLNRAIGASVALMDEMVRNRRFRSCQPDMPQPWPLRPWFVHFSVLWGFIGLALATVLDFLFKAPGSMVPLWYPPRMIGTVAGLLLMYGATVTIVRRLRPTDQKRVRPLPSDWLFLGLLFVVGLTGFLLEVAVYFPVTPVLGYGLFLLHVVLAMELLVLLPFMKFAHAIYRPLGYWIYRFQTPAVS